MYVLCDTMVLKIRDRQNSAGSWLIMKTADGKEIKVKYGFNEVCYMDDWLNKHPEYKIVDYKFTFAYGYILYYTEKS